MLQRLHLYTQKVSFLRSKGCLDVAKATPPCVNGRIALQPSAHTYDKDSAFFILLCFYVAHLSPNLFMQGDKV